MDLAILVPVLNRPHRVEPLLVSIADATPEQHRVIFAASDEATIAELERLGATYITDEGGPEGTWPKRINRLYREVNEPYIFCGADDLLFHPGWFHAAMIVMQDIDGVVAVNDLMNSAGVHLLISRNYIETVGAAMGEPLGTVMCEKFAHAYVDDFARRTALHHGRWGYAKESIVEHLHVGNGKAPMDSTYLLGESTMTSGAEMYRSLDYLFNGND